MRSAERVTPDMIRRWVAHIASVAGDDERAHVEEDAMKDCVLQAIAEGCDEPQECAKEALKSCEISFCRWCA